MRHAIPLAEHRRRERLALLARAVVEGVRVGVLAVVFTAVLLLLCGLLIAAFVALAPSGASLPGVIG